MGPVGELVKNKQKNPLICSSCWVVHKDWVQATDGLMTGSQGFWIFTSQLPGMSHHTAYDFPRRRYWYDKYVCLSLSPSLPPSLLTHPLSVFLLTNSEYFRKIFSNANSEFLNRTLINSETLTCLGPKNLL